MKLSAEALLDWRFDDVVSDYSEKDSILYALGVGLGADPVDPGQLRFVYEKELRVMPTMAVTLGHPGPWTANPDIGIDRKRVVHAGQGLEIHRPLAPSGRIRGRNRIVGVADKGADKGVVIATERRLFDDRSGDLLATLHNFTFCRADGGCGSAGTMPPPSPPVPGREPDHRIALEMPFNASLLYRLSGDLNPLHADPDFALKAGFEKPIAHGLLSYAMACHAVARTLCGYDTGLIRRFDARLSAPVFPGETLVFHLWEVEGGVGFQGWVRERNVLALNNGWCGLASGGTKSETGR